MIALRPGCRLWTFLICVRKKHHIPIRRILRSFNTFNNKIQFFRILSLIKRVINKKLNIKFIIKVIISFFKYFIKIDFIVFFIVSKKPQFISVYDFFIKIILDTFGFFLDFKFFGNIFLLVIINDFKTIQFEIIKRLRAKYGKMNSIFL